MSQVRSWRAWLQHQKLADDTPTPEISRKVRRMSMLNLCADLHFARISLAAPQHPTTQRFRIAVG